ncbi:peroxiredoxin [Oceanicella actignis]|uniref:Glutathione-dependent peroxiredoxin n=1 Tax=Oceanicella actignis TaxID=1189325 RepID=A0A1M7RR83_9RHOB|nr:peroxiredoxin [Oceanicella actignis]TYO89541.1 cytochrome c peroxidase [Oceanicella actignis]SET07107.1 thiol peroxidase (atypical 2-Cys peroxiredoxin) [Oceanicella actignis]SHN48837.1 cytochrome c peroxidase [Oceanicella actignis]
MTIEPGQRLPEARFLELGPEGPVEVPSEALFKGRRVAVFAVPGAFTPTCSNAHLPSFVKAAGELSEKGVDEIVCIASNDPFVMRAWGEATGALEAGIRMLTDPDGAFVRALGLDFSAPPAGLFNRAKRFSMLVEDGELKVLNVEDNPGQAVCSTGEVLVDMI